MIPVDESVISGIARYDKDSMRYHRFKVKSEEGVKGSVYIPMDLTTLPARLILELTTD
jgi:hypothetical protein